VSLHGSILQASDAVDLHLHTLASDGFWTPDALTAYLAEQGFRVAAVCDHDTQRSVVEAIRLGAERGVSVIPGVEVTCRWEDRQIHLLVYGIRPDRDDEDAALFQALMREIDEDLHRKALDARERFEASGRALPSLEGLLDGRVMWPFHVLSAAIQDKHVPNLKESAEMLVELGGAFSADLPLGDVVDAVHQAGGLCLIAHPGRDDAVGIVTEQDLDRMLESHPIDGLEAHYRSYTDEQTTHYREIAQARGLLISCGSDSHGPGKPVDPRPYRAAWCAALLARFGIDVDLEGIEGPVWEAGMDPLAAKPGGETPEEQVAEGEKEAREEIAAGLHGPQAEARG
jgi:3',5'-nucleoside bisphosphate phosphatase